MDILFLIGRILFGGYFLMNGMNHLFKSAGLAGYAASKGVPQPKLAVFSSGLLILFGGVAIILGVYILYAVGALALFLIPVSFMMHAFWKISDPMQKIMEQVNFMKNMALLGAALMLLSIPMPWIMSIAW
jgi:uncharacterized membrane protein YphA (DoxX/SURF4 family)